jgi:hypothetical protein
MNFTSLHENWVLYQGTTLVGPQVIENMSGYLAAVSYLAAASISP